MFKMKKVLNYLDLEFLENGNVMFFISIIISILLLFILWKQTNGFKILGWKLFLHAFLCIPFIIFGMIMIAFPNGTLGVTQHVYLGIIMYSLCVLIFHISQLLSFPQAIII